MGANIELSTKREPIKDVDCFADIEEPKRTRIMESRVLDVIRDYEQNKLGKRELMDIICKMINREIMNGKSKAEEAYKEGYDEGFLF